MKSLNEFTFYRDVKNILWIKNFDLFPLEYRGDQEPTYILYINEYSHWSSLTHCNEDQLNNNNKKNHSEQRSIDGSIQDLVQQLFFFFK